MAGERFDQRQRMVQHRLLLQDAVMLEIPTLVIDKALEMIIKDPEGIESKFIQLSQERSGRYSNSSTDNPFFYTSLVRSLSPDQSAVRSYVKSGDRKFRAPAIDLAKTNAFLAYPDVTYEVRGYGEFSLIPSEHLKPFAMELHLVQLPKTIRPFASWLVMEKNWIVRTLTDCYLAIGKAQAPFLLNVDPRQLLELPISRIDVNLDLPYSMTTYYRLLRRRAVKINSGNVTTVLPILFLLPSKDEVLMYNLVPKLDSIFKEEFRSKLALSDQEITKRLSSTARRTVAKYRKLANIPTRWARQKEYCAGKEGAFLISTPIESYLSNDFKVIDVAETDGAQDAGLSVRKPIQTDRYLEWVCLQKPSTLRALYYWAKQLGYFRKEIGVIYSVVQCLDRKKTPCLADARKVSQLYRKAVKLGFVVDG